MPFLVPVFATVAIAGGVSLARDLGKFSLGDPEVAFALAIAGLLSAVGFGVTLPNEVRIYRELVSEAPDVDRVGRLGMLDAKLGGVQGVLRLSIALVMAYIWF